MFCPKCGFENPEGNQFCSRCGTPFAAGYNATGYNPYTPVPHYDNGGLIAWSIITILLCTIPGIVGLIYAININKCNTVEEQTKKISTCKTWCTVGTILGILAVIVTVIGNMAN